MNRCLAACCLALLTVSCAQKKTIEQLELTHGGLRISLAISPDRENPALINGKLKVINRGTGMTPYGNYRLFLEADDRQVVTTMKTKGAAAHVDSRPVTLSPGDSLDFFVEWEFDHHINFNKATFMLHYIDTAGVQSGGVTGG